MVDYTQVMYGAGKNKVVMCDRNRAKQIAENETDDSDRPNSRRSSYRKKSLDLNGKPGVPSRQGSRAKSVSPRKIPRAADIPAKSPSKTAASVRGSKSNGTVSFAELESEFSDPSAESPRYRPPPAHRPSINIFTKEPLKSPRTPGNPNFDLNGSRRPSEYIFADRNPPPQSLESPPIKRSPQFNQSAPFNKSHQTNRSARSPQISPNTVKPPENYRSTTETSPGIPNRSASGSTDIIRRPSVYPFLPMDQMGNHPSVSAPSTPKPNKLCLSRRASERLFRRGTHGTQSSPRRRQSSNFFLKYSKTSTPNTPNVPTMCPPPPPSDPAPATTPVPPPPPLEDPTTSPAPQKTNTNSKRKSVVKRIDSQDIANNAESTQYLTIDSSNDCSCQSLSSNPANSYSASKGVEKLKRKKKMVIALRKANKSSTKPQQTLRPRPTIICRNRQRAPPAEDAPSRNTRAAALERRRRGRKPLARGTRFGYEVLEKVEAEARAVRKVRRERKRVERELRGGVVK